MLRIIKIFSLILLIIFISSCSDKEYNITISEKKINDVVSSQFPYEKNVLITRLILDNPNVNIQKDSINLTFNYTGKILEKNIDGSADVNGEIVYKRGDFFITNFKINDVEVESVNFNDESKAISAINTIILNYFDEIKVYSLNEDDFKESLVKLILKDIKLIDNNIIVTLGS